MNDRRTFLAFSLATTAAALAAANTENAGASAASQPARSWNTLNAALQRAMQDMLVVELGDASLAGAECAALLDVGFHWTPPSRPAAEFKTIVAYSFGNRPPQAGEIGPQPGPVNEELARVVFQLHSLNHAPIFAQWEITRFLDTKSGLADVVAIEPVVAKDGTVTYLSTDGVAGAVVAHVGGKAESLGPVAVVAHRDHAKRCVLTSRARGMDAYVASEVLLPVTYDPNSGQPWTRRRDIYLLHDMAAQMMQWREERIAREFPNG